VQGKAYSVNRPPRFPDAPKGPVNMTILVDTNVALDILLNRQPWYTEAALIFSLSKQRLITAYFSATTVTGDHIYQALQAVTPDQFIHRVIDLE
jgi:predicted nucleic acid-binding protein